MAGFTFHVVEHDLQRHHITDHGDRNVAYLIFNTGWNDFSLRTEFALVVFDGDGVRHDVGDVKIAQKGMQHLSWGNNNNKTELPAEFPSLPDDFFSLGQNENYYETIYLLPEDLRGTILSGLRDCAANLHWFEHFRHEEVMKDSLLRFVEDWQVRNRFHRIITGNPVLTAFNFKYTLPKTPKGDESEPPVLEFSIEPHSIPPTNVHALIGSNGVGKSRCLHFMTLSLLHGDKEPFPMGDFSMSRGSQVGEFAGLVTVSFSVFDRFDLPKESLTGVHLSSIGLRKEDAEGNIVTKTQAELAGDFCVSLDQCRAGPRAGRWLEMVTALENDPLFKEENIKGLLDVPKAEQDEASYMRFSRLSSGHAIVLLTMTRLVELVDESTLVLLDEPEGHLHPPLLSAFIRSLSDLLIKRNGVAIVSTHSPVVLQEVPSTCVWMLQRSGYATSAYRPSTT